MHKPSHRYAIYYAPSPEGVWWQAASYWLGRCAFTQKKLLQPEVTGLTREEFQAVTAAPRRYGWHATLKAPFFLASGITVEKLHETVKNFAASYQSFDLPQLQTQLLGDFLALTPIEQSNTDRVANIDPSGLHPLHSIADACVRDLAFLAAPISESDLQRRRQAHLTREQDALLVRWGYPYVMEEYRFHCSLTGSLKGLTTDQTAALKQAAIDFFHDLPDCRFDTLALFEEPERGADFILSAHFSLKP